jgi:hypothetical protein
MPVLDKKVSELAELAPALTDILPIVRVGEATSYFATLAALLATDPTRPTADQKAALVGSSGAPSAVNVFVTNTDARLSDARTPTSHTHSLTTEVTGILPAANGGTGAAAFTAGSMVYVGAAGVYAQDNANFFWDPTNKRLGIGINVPLARIHLRNTAIGATHLLIDSEMTSTTTKWLEVRRTSDNYSFLRVYFKSGAGIIWEADAGVGMRFYVGNSYSVRDNPSSDKNILLAVLTTGWTDTVSTANLQLGNTTNLHTVISPQSNTGANRLVLNYATVQVSSLNPVSTPLPVAMHEVLSDSTTKITTIVKAKAAQTADLSQWRDSAGVPMLAVGPSGYLDGWEMTAPAAPAANGWRLYGEDDGAGKTRLMVRFNTGAAQQVAIQP